MAKSTAGPSAKVFGEGGSPTATDIVWPAIYDMAAEIKVRQQPKYSRSAWRGASKPAGNLWWMKFGLLP